MKFGLMNIAQKKCNVLTKTVIVLGVLWIAAKNVLTILTTNILIFLKSILFKYRTLPHLNTSYTKFKTSATLTLI